MERAMTPEYASPEQLRGDSQTTTSDIYSLGAVLHKLLTGRSPRATAGAAREIPKDLACIVSKTLRAEPEERYGSVDLLIGDLRAYLEHRPVQARRGNTLYHARKFVRRCWLPVGAVALARAGHYRRIAGGQPRAWRARSVDSSRCASCRSSSSIWMRRSGLCRVRPRRGNGLCPRRSSIWDVWRRRRAGLCGAQWPGRTWIWRSKSARRT